MAKTETLSRQTLEILAFAYEQLGVDLYRHEGQMRWLNNSTKLVNILRPGNQWGKTLILAIKHIYHAMTKMELKKFGIGEKDPMEWLKAEYITLNFGKTYEIAKGVHETIVALVAGEYALVDEEGRMYLNKSRITSAIQKEDNKDLPYILWWNGSVTLTRSTDDLGSSFKRRRLAFVSGDEIGDIGDIISVLNATVIPRIAFYQGKVDLIGTPQNPGEYQELIEQAEAQKEELGEENATYYVQQGSMFENPGLSKEYVKKVESTADPILRRRIIYGEIVEYGERYFSMNEVQNAINEDMYWRKETGIITPPLTKDQALNDKAWYVMSVDFAAVNDRTIITIIRYDCYPAKMVYLRFFKGLDVPIPMQYQLVREAYYMYAETADRIKLIFDANALGGKIAEVNLKELHGMPFPPAGYSAADAKAQALGALKGLMDEGRQIIEVDGVQKDVNPAWGGLHMPDIRALRLELEGYKLKDEKIKNDFVVTLAQAAFYITKKKRNHNFERVRPIDFQRIQATQNQSFKDYQRLQDPGVRIGATRRVANI